MKKTILTLIIGILIGAIITTAVFLIIKKSGSSNNASNGDFQGFDKSQMMQDENFIKGDKPDDQGKDADSSVENTTSEENNTI